MKDLPLATRSEMCSYSEARLLLQQIGDDLSRCARSRPPLSADQISEMVAGYLIAGRQSTVAYQAFTSLRLMAISHEALRKAADCSGRRADEAERKLALIVDWNAAATG